jgi:hypothetical protein
MKIMELAKLFSPDQTSVIPVWLIARGESNNLISLI